MAGFRLTGAGCRDKEGKFVPVSQCTGRRPTGQKSLGGTSVATKMKMGEIRCIRGRRLRRTRAGARFIKGTCTGRNRILKKGTGR